MVKKNNANRAEKLETTCRVCDAATGELHEVGCTVEPSRSTADSGEGGPGPQSRTDAEMAAEPSRRHETELVQEGAMSAEADAKFAPLVRAVLKAGIETHSCMEDGSGLVLLEFDKEADLVAFLEIVVNRYEKGRDSLYNRSVGIYRPTVPESTWEFDIYPLDIALHDECDEEEDVWHEGEPVIDFSYAVRFPPADLPLVLKRLRKHNSGRKQAA